MRNAHSRRLKELIKRNNLFLLADIDFNQHTYERQSIFHGFKGRREIRGPSFWKLPSPKELGFLTNMGYDLIVFDEKSLMQWFRKGKRVTLGRKYCFTCAYWIRRKKV